MLRKKVRSKPTKTKGRETFEHDLQSIMSKDKRSLKDISDLMTDGSESLESKMIVEKNTVKSTN